jgi:hypothetical protein
MFFHPLNHLVQKPLSLVPIYTTETNVQVPSAANWPK